MSREEHLSDPQRTSSEQTRSSRGFVLFSVFLVSVISIFLILRTSSEGTLSSVRSYVPPCYFFKFTGIKCLGCGGGRAMFECLHGDYLQAIHYNFWWIAALLTVLIEYIHSFLTMRYGVQLPQGWVRFRLWYLPSFAVFSVIFMVARNIWDF